MKIYQKFYDTDVGYSFFNSKVAIFSFVLFLIIAFCSLFAEFVKFIKFLYIFIDVNIFDLPEIKL